MEINERIGAASWGFRELILEEQLKICKELCLSSLELGIANAPKDVPLNISDAQIEEIVDLYKMYGIKLNCAATGNDFTLENRTEIEEQIKKVKAVISICQKAGIQYLRIFAGFSPVDEVIGKRFEQMVNALNEVADYAQNCGVVLALEVHGGVKTYADGVEHFDSVSTNPETLMKMLMKIRTTIQFVFDPANLAAAGYLNLSKQYEILQDRIAYIHAKNFEKLSSGHLNPSVVETGIFDWLDFLDNSNSYKGNYYIEYEKTDTIEEGTRESKESLEKWGIGK